MKVRTPIAGTVLSTRLTAAGFGVLTVLASVGISACSGGSSPTTPAIFSPSVTGSATASGTAGSGTAPTTSTSPLPGTSASPPATASPTVTVSPTTTVFPTVTVTTSPPVTISPSPTASRSASAFPTAAPSTGGGGTAGVQDVLLFGLGGAAIVAGGGSIAYRRKLTRGR
jgi:cytoskeletal protein RodZ